MIANFHVCEYRPLIRPGWRSCALIARERTIEEQEGEFGWMLIRNRGQILTVAVGSRRGEAIHAFRERVVKTIKLGFEDGYLNNRVARRARDRLIDNSG